MKISDEFLIFVQMFHQDIVYEENPIEDSIKSGVCRLTEEERERLKQYFSEILAANLSDEQLEYLWFDTSADVGFDGPGVKYVMTETLKRL